MLAFHVKIIRVIRIIIIAVKGGVYALIAFLVAYPPPFDCNGDRCEVESTGCGTASMPCSALYRKTALIGVFMEKEEGFEFDRV